MTDPIRIPPSRDLPSAALERQKEHLMSELVLQQQSRSRRRRRLALVLVPTAIVLAVATGFTAYALTREPTQLESIGCYDRADLSANTTIVNADGRDPVAICAEVWRQGAMDDTPKPPRLAACVLESGAVGVFPSLGADTCARLGMAGLPPSYAANRKRFAALRDAIVTQLGEPATGSSRGSPKCVPERDARTIVRRELDAHGYSEWQIEVTGDGFTAERPCAEVAFDGKRKVVLLIPVWRRTG